MQLHKFALADTHAFNSFFLDYVNKKSALKPFYNRYPTIENFEAQLQDRSHFPSDRRDILVKVLEEQYETLKGHTKVTDNIQALRNSKTFTITTGHQLNIFTGPLYFIYKIITVINTAKMLSERYPDFHFVPVYWMASEDHDYDEIKYFRLYGKKYEWKTHQKGAVGRYSPNGLADLASEIPGENSLFLEAYSKSATLAEAVRRYIDRLFGEYGLVVIDPDHASLKRIFSPVIKDDIFDGVGKNCVEPTTKALEDLGYKTQVFCRDINFFYLEDGLRSRIEKKGEKYQVLDTNLSFSDTELREMIDSKPQRFSPNVILRPLYQEMILPNLAYIGGPAEMVYWLQLRAIFENYDLPFPMLMPRNFAMIVDHEVSRKIDKTGLELRDLFEEKNFLFNHWVLKHSPRNLTVGPERNSISELFAQLSERAAKVDGTLTPFVGAEGKRALNSLEKIERKLLRAEKRLHADKLRQIEFVKDALFPKGGLQERTDNFLNFYHQDPAFIAKLAEAFDPFDFSFNVLMT